MGPEHHKLNPPVSDCDCLGVSALVCRQQRRLGSQKGVLLSPKTAGFRPKRGGFENEADACGGVGFVLGEGAAKVSALAGVSVAAEGGGRQCERHCCRCR